jgi:transcriptional regulator with XRE-family HTH domain
LILKTTRKRRTPNNKFRKALGKRIQELRKGITISQAQLGFETGVHRDQIGRIERGIQSPSADTLEAMATVFEMKLKDFLDFKY